MKKQKCESQNPPRTPSVPELPGTYLANHEDYGWCMNVMAGAGTRTEVKEILKEYCSNEGELDEVAKAMQGYITIYRVHKF